MSSSTAYTTSNFPTYRFYVTTFNPAATIEVFPLNFLASTIVWERESGHVFYRKKFNGKLLFGTDSTAIDDSGAEVNRMDDYDLFWFIESLDPCFTIDFEIKRTVSGVEASYWTGTFSTSEGTFDLDKCTFEVTPLIDDSYNLFLDKFNDEYNMIDMSSVDVPEITTAMTRGVTTYTYTHNRFVLDVLQYIVDDITGGASTVTSTFLSDATNPVTQSANRFLYLTIAQKLDIKLPTATESQTVAMVSFNSLMQILRCLQLDWDFDGTDIRVEHVSFDGFHSTAGGIDLWDHPMAAGMNKYSYMKEVMPKYERFNWMEADANFRAWPIWYDSNCVNQDSDTNNVELSLDVTTDIEYIQNCMADPDLVDVIADEGFVLLANRIDGANYYTMVAETGDGGGNPVRFNGDLSWRSLHEFYFRHERVLIQGYLNNILSTFYTAKKTKKQSVSIISCETFDPTKAIRSELGEDYFGGADADVEKAVLEPSGLMKLDLVYGPEDNANTGNAPSQCMRVEEIGSDPGAGQSTYYFTLTEAADAALVADPPSVQVIGQDAGANDCTSAWVVAVVNLGDFTFSVTVTWPILGECVAPWVGPSICLGLRNLDAGAWVGTCTCNIIYDDTVSC